MKMQPNRTNANTVLSKVKITHLFINTEKNMLGFSEPFSCAQCIIQADCEIHAKKNGE